MKKLSLSKTGLSLSQAQSVSNLCYQKSQEIANQLAVINNSEKTLTIGSEIYFETVGNPIPKNVVELVIEKGAKSVRAIATHGVLSGKAYENLDSSVLSELLVSDSIPSKLGDSPKLKYISCDNIIAKAIWSLSNQKSIHEINSI